MNITFIGSGNVATHLALALHGCGHTIQQVWSRDLEHAELLAQRVEADPINHFQWLRKNADVYIVAVTDDALFDIALDLQVGNALVLHTSGATGIEVLRSTSTRYGVVWSPQSFVRDMALDYRQLPFCIEGCDAKTEDDIAALVSTLSPHIHRTTLQQRQYLHLAAVMVNNFTSGLYAMAQQLCMENQLPFEILHPIILSTAKRIQYADVRYTLTGPAVRKDTRTLRAHQKLLADKPEYLEIYNKMTLLLQEIAKEWRKQNP